MIGRVSSWRAVIAPWLADCAMPTRSCAGAGASARLVKVDLPVTVTSALRARCITDVDCLAVAVDRDHAPDRGKVDEGEGDVEPPGREPVDSILAAVIAVCLPGGSARAHLDEHARERSARLVEHGTAEVRGLRPKPEWR